MKYCWHCGKENQDDAHYCRHCGAQFAPVQAVVPALAAPYPQASGFAIASLVLGIIWIYWLGSILALVFGYIARSEIRRDPQRLSGRGMATAGIVLGWVGIATLVLAIVGGIFIYLSEQEKSSPGSHTTHSTSARLIR